jgi:hypothetical protein
MKTMRVKLNSAVIVSTTQPPWKNSWIASRTELWLGTTAVAEARAGFRLTVSATADFEVDPLGGTDEQAGDECARVPSTAPPNARRAWNRWRRLTALPMIDPARWPTGIFKPATLGPPFTGTVRTAMHPKMPYAAASQRVTWVPFEVSPRGVLEPAFGDALGGGDGHTLWDCECARCVP